MYTFKLDGLTATPVQITASTLLGASTAVGISPERQKDLVGKLRTILKGPTFQLSIEPAVKDSQVSTLELAAALSVLVARETMKPAVNMDRVAICGDLSSDSNVQPVRGSYSIGEAVTRANFDCLIMPMNGAYQALGAQQRLPKADRVPVIGVHTLQEAIEYLEHPSDTFAIQMPHQAIQKQNPFVDFGEVVGKPRTRRALEIAAAGGHNVLLVGKPGTASTMLARRITTILPKMSTQEVQDTARVYSAMGLLPGYYTEVKDRPFRAPHYTISASGLTGTGRTTTPGEASLANAGVLLLDELAEFSRMTLDVLFAIQRDGFVDLSSVNELRQMPGKFMVIATMEQCPYANATPEDTARFTRRMAPTVAHFEIAVDVDADTEPALAEVSAVIQRRVEAAQSVTVSADISLPEELSEARQQAIRRVATTIMKLDGSVTWMSQAVEEATYLTRFVE